MIAHAVAAHASDPLCTFTTDPDALRPADYTLASGVFNVKQDHPATAWQDYVLDALGAMDRLSERGFAFNMLSTYSDADRQRTTCSTGSRLSFSTTARRIFRDGWRCCTTTRYTNSPSS